MGGAPVLEPGELLARLTSGAWPLPGTVAACVVSGAAARDLERALGVLAPVRVGWRQREALLGAWRPAAQERYHSVAGQDAPTVAAWLGAAFSLWKPGPGGVHRLEPDPAAVERALGLCGLKALAGSPLSLLSNGEIARVCLARALAAGPRVLVLDNVCEGLDAAGRALLGAAAEACAQDGAAVLHLAAREGLLPWVGAPPPPARWAARVGAGPGPGVERFRCEGLDLWAGARPLVRGLDWSVRAGEAWLLTGPNGAGKSTLLAYLSGEHPQAWARSWSLNGRGREVWTPLARLREQVAWVGPELAAAAGVSPLTLLERALEGPARLLLLDEALRGLGAEELAAAEDRLARAHSEGKERAWVWVSHAPEEVPGFVTRILALDGAGGWREVIRP